jgi:hypothetical protein
MRATCTEMPAGAGGGRSRTHAFELRIGQPKAGGWYQSPLLLTTFLPR